MFFRRFLFCFLVFGLLAAVGCRRQTGTADVNANNSTAPGAGQPVSEFTDPNAALAEGKRLLENGETEKAIQALEQAVKLNPDLAEGYFQLGIAWSLIEVREKTAEMNGEAQATPEPSPEKVAKGKGKDKETKLLRLTSEKYFQKAVDAYKKLVDANDQDASAYFNLGRAYNKLNEDEDAEKALRQAVKLNAEDTEYQTELGAIEIKLAKYDEAVAALKKALDLDPDNSKAQDLLEDAQAGQKRVAYVTKPKDDKKPGSNSNTNSGTPGSSGAGSDEPPPPPPAGERPRTVAPRPTPAPTRN